MLQLSQNINKCQLNSYFTSLDAAHINTFIILILSTNTEDQIFLTNIQSHQLQFDPSGPT